MLRIGSGIAKNKRLKVPNVEGARAVQEKARHSIFSIIGERILNSECLDLYAGSGVLGLEALSRGAKSCDFVDKDPLAVKVIIENLKNCGFDEEYSCNVYRSDSIKFVANNDKKYDFIFVDPFFEDHSHKFLMKNLAEVLKTGGLIVFSHGKDLNIESLADGTDLKISTSRRFGKAYFDMVSNI